MEEVTVWINGEVAELVKRDGTVVARGRLVAQMGASEPGRTIECALSFVGETV